MLPVRGVVHSESSSDVGGGRSYIVPPSGAIGAIFAALAMLACSSTHTPSPVFRLDDHLTEARVDAAGGGGYAQLAKPVSWDFDTPPEDWVLSHGNLGFTPGHMVLQGDRRGPEVGPPGASFREGGEYEAALIRLQANGGRQIKVRVGEWEASQPLAPPGDFQIYRFELGENSPTEANPLVIIPTDDPGALVSIDFVKLQPRRILYPEDAGKTFVGKQADYRNVIYAHTPASLTYEVAVAGNASLRFAMGMGEKGAPIRFAVSVGGEELSLMLVDDADVWSETSVDLSSYAGQTIQLTFRAESDTAGAVGLWANPAVVNPSERTKPNVLVYMIDTLRADRTSLYGHSRPTTPFLDKLGGEGVVFEDCHVQCTWTKPSVASMMTSIHAVTHGITEGEHTIPAGATTLAEELRENGWTTASVVANPFAGKATGLERGFDSLVEFPAIRRRQSSEQRDTDSKAINAIALPWIEQHRDEPFFLYLHSTDPHAPYRPPAAYEKEFSDPAESDRFQVDFSKMVRHRLYGGAVFNRLEAKQKGVDPDLFVRRALDRYDAEIAHNDKNIETLVTRLEELGILSNTLVVVVSDHGEEFLEHGWTGHGHSLYQEQTHGVMMMWNPKLLPEARRVSGPVQLIDLRPTLLELVGLKPKGVVQGRSRVALLRGESDPDAPAVMTSRMPPHGSEDQEIPQSQTRTFARIDDQWKMIYREDAAKTGLSEVELYDRKKDPTDQHDLAAENPAVVKPLLAEIHAWVKEQDQVREMLGPLGESQPDEAMLDRLRTLGYVGEGTK